MSIEKFARESGFKVLAMARLSAPQYAVLMYLVHCSASGMEQVITTIHDLTQLVGASDEELRGALSELAQRGFIRLKFTRSSSPPPGAPQQPQPPTSLRMGLNYELRQWSLNIDEELVTSSDAVIYPFRRQGALHLQVFQGRKRTTLPESQDIEDRPQWKDVFDTFIKNRSLDEDEIEQATDQARILAETHPAADVVSLLKHFGPRIPTLSLLLSSWEHYQELHASETEKIDMLEARQRHLDLDQKLRDAAGATLLRSKELELTDEERTVLQILQSHKHPRRQLYWAYQLRSRYPHLEPFFGDHATLMLGVTTSGSVLKRPFGGDEP